MILTTTCDQYEFGAITRRATELGIQITAAPGFIYLKDNWIVGNTLEDEAHFNARVPSTSVTPPEFLSQLKRVVPGNHSLAIICDDEEQRESVIDHFKGRGYTLLDTRTPDGLAIFIIPAEKSILIRFNYIARDNAKEGYQVINFEAFKTIAL